MNYTEKYHLPQWVESDRILMTDFNQMCADIEAGLTEVKSGAEQGQSQLGTELASAVEALTAAVGSGGHTCRIAYGSYTGTGTFGAANPTTLHFDFQPVLVVVGTPVTVANMAWPTVLIRGSESAHSDNSVAQLSVTWTDNGVSWYNTSRADSQNNAIACTYFYAAMGCNE